MQRIEAPEISAARGGLLEVLAPADGDGHLTYHGVTYEGGLCGPARDYTPGEDKIFDRQTVLNGEPFVIYRGVEVNLFARDNAKALVEETFAAGETYAVERGLQRTTLNPNAVDITPTPGTPVSTKVGVGLLEQYAGDYYGGLPMLHVNRFGTAVLAGDLEVDDQFRLTTKQGTPVANGAGYSATGPGDVAAAAGQFWVYVTGQVNLWRSDVSVHVTDDMINNQTHALAERSYVPTVECLVAAVLVTVPA